MFWKILFVVLELVKFIFGRLDFSLRFFLLLNKLYFFKLFNVFGNEVKFILFIRLVRSCFLFIGCEFWLLLKWFNLEVIWLRGLIVRRDKWLEYNNLKEEGGLWVK